MITLQAVDRNDADLILEAWGRDPENFQFLTAQVFSDTAAAQRYLSGLFPTPESMAFHIVHPASGIIGLVKAPITEHRAKIGYVVHRPFWGQGIATTAVRQVTEMLEVLPTISRVWATCAVENHASARVLEKCGFQREAILRKWVRYPAQGGRALDNYSYVKV